MKVIPPITIATGGVLTSTNVTTAGDPAAYDAGTTYALGDRCVAAETIYQSLEASNLGNDPASSPTKWAEVGPINKLAMFDRRVGSQTVFADTIEVVLTPGEVVDTAALRNVDAASVTAVQTDPVDGVVKTWEISLVEPVSDGWEYCFYPIERMTDVLITDILPYRNSSIEIVIDNTGDDAKCGLCVIGQSLEPGGAQYGATDGITDYSLVRADGFGVRDIVERDYADDAEFSVRVPSDQSPRFRRVMTERRAQPTLIVLADHRPDAMYYGLPSFRRVFSYPNEDIFNVTVKGL